MNCFSMMPNCYYNTPIQAPFAMGMPFQRENPISSGLNILQALSQALNKSVRNYEQKYLSASSKDNNMEQKEVPQEIKVNIQKRKEQVMLGEETFKNSIEQKKSQLNIKKLPSVEKTNLVPQHPTDDEIHPDSKELSSFKNDVSSKKKNKKHRRQEKVSDFVVVVPEVDLIDHAYIQPCGIAAEALAKKKESLMERQVNNGSDFMKVKKEKREIRMLGN